MEAGELLVEARRAAGLTQKQLAERAGTSRTTLSAYERNRKSPTVATMERLLAVTGSSLKVEPSISFTDQVTRYNRVFTVPNRLPRLFPKQALAVVRLPLHVDWSTPKTAYDLSDRKQRIRCYERVLREGTSKDLLTYIDGAFLVEAWDDLVIPRDIRAAWQPIIEAGV